MSRAAWFCQFRWRGLTSAATRLVPMSGFVVPFGRARGTEFLELQFMVQKRCRNGAKIRSAGETKDKIMEYRIMRLDAGNAEGGRVASGRRQLNGNAFLDSSFHRLPGDPLVVFCRILSCFVVFCRPLLARAGKGEAADGRQV